MVRNPTFSRGWHPFDKAVFNPSLSFTYCRDGVGEICKLETVHWIVPIELAADATQTAINLTASVREN